jgi:hypothetical protein
MFLCFRLKKPTEAVHRKFVEKRNAKMAKKFAETPFAERIILVPHCMRNIEHCKAKEIGSHYICTECNACKIGAISKKSKELGYNGLFVLKGGKAVEKLIVEKKPKAIIAVACFFEGAQGMELCEKHHITVQFVPLTKDGCVATDVELNDVITGLEKTI